MSFRLDQFSNTPQLSDEEQLAFNKAEVVPFKKDAFDPRDFSYPAAQKEEDARRLAEIQRSPIFRSEDAGESAPFEYAVMSGIKVDGWFGDEVEAVRKTAPYDDVMHGVDFVVTFIDPYAPEPKKSDPPDVQKAKRQAQLIHLAVDVTMSTDPNKLGAKVAKIGDRLKERRLTRVNYFESEGKQGRAYMPLVVLGTDPGAAVALQRKFLTQRTRIADDPAQLEYLAEAREQLAEWLVLILQEYRIITPQEYNGDPAQVLDLIEHHRDRFDGKDRPLEDAVRAHARALGAILRAEQIKKSLGAIPPERHDVEPFRSLMDPLGRRAG